MQPPAFCSGSRITAATVSGPSNSIALLDLVGRPERVAVGRPAVAVGVGDVDAAGDERLEDAPQRRDAGGREGAQGGAVVGDLPGDQLDLLAVALGAVVAARASLKADSTASEPLLVKKTWFRSPGASEAIRVASSIARGWA